MPMMDGSLRRPLLGIAKAANIILTASEATDPHIGPEMREQLLRLRHASGKSFFTSSTEPVK